MDMKTLIHSLKHSYSLLNNWKVRNLLPSVYHHPRKSTCTRHWERMLVKTACRSNNSTGYTFHAQKSVQTGKLSYCLQFVPSLGTSLSLPWIEAFCASDLHQWYNGKRTPVPQTQSYSLDYILERLFNKLMQYQSNRFLNSQRLRNFFGAFYANHGGGCLYKSGTSYGTNGDYS
jgi:hypothetical protein